MTIALKAWAIEGVVQAGYRGADLTPMQARILARSLGEAADRAELHSRTLVEAVAKTMRQDEDWGEPHGGSALIEQEQ